VFEKILLAELHGIAEREAQDLHLIVTIIEWVIMQFGHFHLHQFFFENGVFYTMVFAI